MIIFGICNGEDEHKGFRSIVCEVCGFFVLCLLCLLFVVALGHCKLSCFGCNLQALGYCTASLLTSFHSPSSNLLFPSGSSSTPHCFLNSGFQGPFPLHFFTSTISRSVLSTFTSLLNSLVQVVLKAAFTSPRSKGRVNSHTSRQRILQLILALLLSSSASRVPAASTSKLSA